jgi:hypothetical protein
MLIKSKCLENVLKLNDEGTIGVGFPTGRIVEISGPNPWDGPSPWMLEHMQKEAEKNSPYKIKVRYDKELSEKATRLNGISCRVLVQELVIDDPPQNVRLQEVE